MNGWIYGNKRIHVFIIIIIYNIDVIHVCILSTCTFKYSDWMILVIYMYVTILTIHVHVHVHTM